MNKNEFYKELLTNYTIDTEKIKCNAKRSKHRNPVSIYKWTGVASAAIVAVTLGVVALSGMFTNSGVSISPRTDPELAAERLRAAELNYFATVSDNNELTEMYVSFNYPLSANEALMAFSAISDAGDINCELLYTVDGTAVSVNGMNSDTTSQIYAGAKISSPAGYYKDISDMKDISLVELGIDGITDDTFIPISGDDKATVTTTEQTEVTNDVDIVLPDESTQAEVTTSGETSAPEEVTEPPVTESTSATVQIPGISSVTFINNSSFIAISSSTVELYHIGEDGAAVLDTKIYTDNPKISWSNSSSTSLFITGCDQKGLRKKLYYANGNAGTLSELDVSTITADAELTGLIVGGDGNIMMFKTVSLEKSRLYIATRNANLLKTSLIVESCAPVSALAYTDGKLYYAVTDVSTGAVIVNVKNTETNETTILANYTAGTKFIKAPTFDRFALVTTSADGLVSVDMLNGDAMSKVEGATNITFSALNSSIYSDDNGWHCISASGTVLISDSDSAAYAGEPGGSVLYSAEITDGTLTIITK